MDYRWPLRTAGPQARATGGLERLLSQEQVLAQVLGFAVFAGIWPALAIINSRQELFLGILAGLEFGLDKNSGSVALHEVTSRTLPPKMS
jgi:hypothetical protein